jgi:hypothetical protein
MATNNHDRKLRRRTYPHRSDSLIFDCAKTRSDSYHNGNGQTVDWEAWFEQLEVFRALLIGVVGEIDAEIVLRRANGETTRSIASLPHIPFGHATVSRRYWKAVPKISQLSYGVLAKLVALPQAADS